MEPLIGPCVVPPISLRASEAILEAGFQCRLPLGDGFGHSGGEDRLVVDGRVHLAASVSPGARL